MMQQKEPQVKPRISFKRKLLTGATVVMVFIFMLLSLGNSVIQRAAERQEQVRKETVKPLADMSNLQSQMYRLRVTEANLPQIHDYFALAAEIAEMEKQVETFAESLVSFAQANRSVYKDPIRQIEQNWLLLTESLEQVEQAASSMDIDEVIRLSTYQAHPRFDTLIIKLEKLSQLIERDAEQSYQLAADDLENQRHNFLIISVAAMFIGVALLLLFARYLSGRVNYLHDAFNQVAAGKVDDEIDIRGNDELAELAVAFNAMREKVATRQRALNQAREELEIRVEQRTEELSDTNLRLQAEIDERRKMEEELRILSPAVAQSPVSVIIVRVDGSVEYVNQAFTDCSGYSAEEIKDGPTNLLNEEQNGAEVSNEIWAAVNAGEEWRGELCNQRKSGELYWEYTHISPVADENGVLTHYLVIKVDITERKEQDQKILYQARYDALTELPNRTLAMDRLAQSVIYAQRNNEKLALMFIDLDGFKNVNDSLGHEMGDALLVQAAQRLKRSVRDSDTVARLGGDEFLLIMTHLPSREACQPVLNKISKAFSQPFKLGNNELSVTPSIGLAVYPEDGQDGAVLLRNADLAMYQAKEAGKNTYHFFNQSIHENLRKRIDIENQLKGALERDEVYLLYQPIIDAVDKSLVGVEALIRWENSDLGRVMPDEFIGIAEQSGLIVPIGNWVVETAVAQVSQWQKSGLGRLSLSINVSPRQINGNELKPVIQSAIEKHNFPADQLMLEMTEGLLIRNPQEASKILTDLKDIGLKLAMDDFGTGYSSLSNLKKFPFDILKIDRTFVRDIEHDAEDLSLVSAAASMSKGLGLTIVAEGVETLQQAEILSEMHCDRLQGFYFSRPLSVDTFWEWSQQYLEH
ncbi:EAL domain-containing protein [Neptuniibacter sp.]|uniref:EAL domain-containing protein n=1 Tax=Neptuniibacter sp. TaxID=1962643 RepID=UPI002636CA96|nr:EAL domain-containing protein [Neptuniibacter sp.]MCP4595498.1 EAL domain-containing protein [Neptuniibacter sp.]